MREGGENEKQAHISEKPSPGSSRCRSPSSPVSPSRSPTDEFRHRTTAPRTGSDAPQGARGTPGVIHTCIQYHTTYTLSRVKS